MAKAVLYWAMLAVALFVVGPVAGPLVGDLRAHDGGGHVTPLTSARPLAGLALTAGAFGLALVVGLAGSWLIGARFGMTLSGLVLAWCAFRSGAPDDILRRTQDTSVLWRFAAEGAAFGALGLIVGAVVLRAGRRHQPDTTSRDSAEHVPLVAMVGGAGAGVVVAAVIAWLFAFETLKMQTIGAAALAGVGAGAVAHLTASALSASAPRPSRTAMAALVALVVLAMVGPVSALAAPSGSGGVLRTAYDGSYFPLAAPLALDWLAGAFLGIPLGLSWSGAMLEKTHA